MKKLIIALAVAVCSTVSFADAQDGKKADTKMHQKKEASLHCYAMKNGAMIECWGEKKQPMTEDATLKNGTMVNTKGEITMKDGKTATLKDGECILAKSGKIMDAMSAHHKKAMDKKMK